MKICKTVTKISFKPNADAGKTMLNIESERGYCKNFLLDNADMLQLEQALNLYNKNFIQK